MMNASKLLNIPASERNSQGRRPSTETIQDALDIVNSTDSRNKNWESVFDNDNDERMAAFDEAFPLPDAADLERMNERVFSTGQEAPNFFEMHSSTEDFPSPEDDELPKNHPSIGATKCCSPRANEHKSSASSGSENNAIEQKQYQQRGRRNDSIRRSSNLRSNHGNASNPSRVRSQSQGRRRGSSQTPRSRRHRTATSPTRDERRPRSHSRGRRGSHSRRNLLKTNSGNRTKPDRSKSETTAILSRTSNRLLEGSIHGESTKDLLRHAYQETKSTAPHTRNLSMSTHNTEADNPAKSGDSASPIQSSNHKSVEVAVKEDITLGAGPRRSSLARRRPERSASKASEQKSEERTAGTPSPTPRRRRARASDIPPPPAVGTIGSPDITSPLGTCTRKTRSGSISRRRIGSRRNLSLDVVSDHSSRHDASKCHDENWNSIGSQSRTHGTSGSESPNHSLNEDVPSTGNDISMSLLPESSHSSRRHSNISTRRSRPGQQNSFTDATSRSNAQVVVSAATGEVTRSAPTTRPGLVPQRGLTRSGQHQPPGAGRDPSRLNGLLQKLRDPSSRELFNKKEESTEGNATDTNNYEEIMNASKSSKLSRYKPGRRSSTGFLLGE